MHSLAIIRIFYIGMQAAVFGSTLLAYYIHASSCIFWVHSVGLSYSCKQLYFLGPLCWLIIFMQAAVFGSTLLAYYIHASSCIWVHSVGLLYSCKHLYLGPLCWLIIFMQAAVFGSTLLAYYIHASSCIWVHSVGLLYSCKQLYLDPLCWLIIFMQAAVCWLIIFMQAAVFGSTLLAYYIHASSCIWIHSVGLLYSCKQLYLGQLCWLKPCLALDLIFQLKCRPLDFFIIINQNIVLIDNYFKTVYIRA